MAKSTHSGTKVTLLAGGVGAARLLRGLARVVPPKNLSVIVNVGDDDTFFGLHVSPDLDTIVYTLAGVAPKQRGWGVRGDTFHAKQALDRFFDTPWFQLGDRDMATNIFRTERLHGGASLSAVTAEICEKFGVKQRVLPVTNDRLATIVKTSRGELAFQEYLVRERGRPRVEGLRYRGATGAQPAPGVLEAIASADALVIAPSNPYVSIDPILAVKGVRAAVKRARSRTVAVSPLIGGKAVKGPLAAMLRSMGERANTDAIANRYAGLASTLVVSPGDLPSRGYEPRRGAPRIAEHDILIRGEESAERIARFALGCLRSGGAE